MQAPRVHHAARRRGGGVAVCGTGAAAGDAGGRVPRSDAGTGYAAQFQRFDKA